MASNNGEGSETKRIQINELGRLNLTFFRKVHIYTHIKDVREGPPWWSSAGGVGSIPGQGNKILHAVGAAKKKRM